ncbi:hypothetical protein [Paenibacillus terrae]|uniref:Uncharacterized protein n=1 Tax=Paenibacillus terrae TaxID=159743 RepID=A0A0D7WVY1_9BACL|nr:hypothetical protein [Paenibacillus terrae]KJD42878.1 hypothetical protein QD47_25760 [Paenibacillus terrae]
MIGWIILGVSLTMFLLVLAVFFLSAFVRNADGKNKEELFKKHFGKKALQNSLNLWYQKGYIQFQRTPFLRKYIWKIRKRLEVLETFDEYAIRSNTMKITFVTLGSTAIIVLLASFISRDLFTIFFVLFGAVVVNGMMIDTFVNRVEDRLLKQSIILFEDCRHHYQRTKNVEEALYESSQTAPHEAAQHGERIYEILTGENQEKALDTYYEVAPNKFFKLFTGFSYLVFEFGDQIVNKSSMYLNSLAKLVQDVNYEILRREKLNYLLKGLSTIAVLSSLFIRPIEIWAKNYFPIMNDFYDSKIGFFIKVIFFGVVLICYALIKKLLNNDEARYVEKSDRIMWEKFLYNKVFPIRWLVDRLAPDSNKGLHFKLSMLIKDANSYLTIEWLYIQRIVLSVIVFLCTILIAFQMHSITIHNTLYVPVQGNGMLGKLGPKEQAQEIRNTNFDRSVIETLDRNSKVTPESLITTVSVLTSMSKNDPATIITANRIYQKFMIIQNEFFKWYELLISIVLCYLAYYFPVGLLHFQKRVRYMEMQEEVDQFHTIISILANFKRMDVETILEWMERYSIIFKDPIKNCLNDYSGGQEHSLEQLEEDVSFEPFARIVQKLKLAASKIPLLEAFDDLELTKEYYSEKRKEHFNRVIEMKANWGRTLGFAPGAYLVFIYLVAPMIYLSIIQAGESFQQIRNISGG